MKRIPKRSRVEVLSDTRKLKTGLAATTAGRLGDKIFALMAAIGYNLRLILKALSFYCKF